MNKDSFWFNALAGFLALLVVALVVTAVVLVIKWIAWTFGVNLTITQCLAINVALTILGSVFKART